MLKQIISLKEPLQSSEAVAFPRSIKISQWKKWIKEIDLAVKNFLKGSEKGRAPILIVILLNVKLQCLNQNFEVNILLG